jgi:hypothetical protein
VNADEILVFQYNAETQLQSVQMKCLFPPMLENMGFSQPEVKIMLTSFLMSNKLAHIVCYSKASS